MKNQQKMENSNQLKNYAKYSSLFIQMAVIIGGGVASGYFIDKSLQFHFPLFTIIFSLISVFAAIYLTIKDFIKKK